MMELEYVYSDLSEILGLDGRARVQKQSVLSHSLSHLSARKDRRLPVLGL